eukprot:809003-Lingulodinium_polyedra.AAC.1
MLSKKEVGKDITTEDQEAWEHFEHLFFAGTLTSSYAAAARIKRQAKARGKGKAAARATKRASDQPRLTALRVLKVLDALLQRATGKGLGHYLPPATPCNLLPHLRPTLSMHLDEGSTGYACMWYLIHHAQARMVVIKDIFHREWNDAKGALMDSKL